MKVYTITSPDEEELNAEGILDFDWEELYLFISPYGRPNLNSDVLWVFAEGDVAKWDNLGDVQIIPDQIVVYTKTEELPVEAKKRFIRACFNKE